MTKRIFVDFDQVLADLHTEWFRILNRRWRTGGRTPADPNKIRGWDGMAKLFSELPPDLVYSPLYIEHLYNRVLPLPGALEGFRALQNHFGTDNVYILTFCTCPEMYASKLEWIDRYEVMECGVTQTPAEFISAQDKSVFGNENDVLIDDGVHNLNFSPCETILITSPHNLASNQRLHTRKESLRTAAVYLMDKYAPFEEETE